MERKGKLCILICETPNFKTMKLKDRLSFIHTLLHDTDGLPEEALQHIANAIKEVEKAEGILDQTTVERSITIVITNEDIENFKVIKEYLDNDSSLYKSMDKLLN